MWSAIPVKFMVIGGVVFLVAAAGLREMTFEGSQLVAWTFLFIGICWILPQVLIAWFRMNKQRRTAEAAVRREGD